MAHGSVSGAENPGYAHIFHELKTPLDEITHAARLAAAADDPGDRHKYLGIVMNAAAGLSELFDCLVGPSPKSGGGEPSRAVPVRIGPFMERTLGPLGVVAELKDLDLRWEIGEKVPPVVIGDSVRIAQILRNLVSNGIKYTSRGGVSVIVDRAEAPITSPRLVFRVRDTGPGIDRDRLEEAFLPFHRSLHTDCNYHAPPGYGLGLSVVKGLLDGLGGTIAYEGGQGTGSVFLFEVPFDFSPPNPDPEISPARSTDAVHPAGCLLLAEDNRISRMYLRHCLEKGGGFTVETADNGAEAVKLCGERIYDLILMDLHMPVLDGFEAARLLRKGTEGGAMKRTPIIALSAYVSQKDYERALDAGFEDVMVKPVHPESLISRVEELIMGFRTAREMPVYLGIDKGSGPSGFDHLMFHQKYRDAESTGSRILALFLEDVPPKIEILHRARLDRDGELCGRTAHSLANAFGTICAPRALRLAREIETALYGGEDSKVDQLIGELRIEEQKVRAGVLEYLSSREN
jgi:CheY-like chemotaxis protein/HPt (histidine-containing phosphotransfer) domain-containing protein